MRADVLITMIVCGTIIVCASLMFYVMALPSWWERRHIKAQIENLQIRCKRMEDK